MNPYASPVARPPGVGYRESASLLARVPPAPREPSARVRPLVFGFGPGGWIALLVGVMFMAMGSLFTRIFCNGLPADFALAVAGQHAEGTVESVAIDKHVRVNGRSPEVVTFTYVAGGERHVATSSHVGGTSRAAGSTVSVEYLPGSSDVARITGTTRNETGYGTVFVLLFPTIGLLLTAATVVAHRRRKRAFRFGTPVMGRVASLAFDTSTKVNGRSPMKLSWTFQDASGRDFVGALSSMNPSVFGERYPEEPIVVLYDPKNPKVNTAWLE